MILFTDFSEHLSRLPQIKCHLAIRTHLWQVSTDLAGYQQMIIRCIIWDADLITISSNRGSNKQPVSAITVAIKLE